MILILAVLFIVVVVALFVLFTEDHQNTEYNELEFKGLPTSFSDCTSQELASWILSRDQKDFDKKKYGHVRELAQRLKTDLENGLTGEDFPQRSKHFGVNKYKAVPLRSFRSFWKQTMEDKTLRILMGSSIVSILLGVTVDEDPSTGWIEGAAILFAVLLVSLVTATNDYSKDRKFRQMSNIHSDKKVSVKRNGQVQVVSIYDLLVGDIVLLGTGNYIPADAIFVSGYGCSVDESAMTGESALVPKSEENPLFISGCMVSIGTATVMVLATGVNSTFGRIKQSIEKETELTPLQEKLDDLADFIGKCGAAAAGCTFLVLVLKWIFQRFVLTSQGWDIHQLSILIDYVITSITIVAVAVPEGLPLAVTISLAYSMVKMMHDQNLVRHLAACETMGGATQICSDKTGTLTQNRMSVTAGWVAGQRIESVSDVSSITKALSPEDIEILASGISVNSTADISTEDNKSILGSPTEGALLLLLRSNGIDYSKVRKAFSDKVIEQFPFSSGAKRMSTIVHYKDSAMIFTKGASEVILSSCTTYFKGRVLPLDEDRKKEFLTDIEKYASRGLRTLTLGFCSFDPSKPVPSAPQNLEYTLIAIFGISDPIRIEVPPAVADCHRAGITVRMLTGDNKMTATDISRQCGIINKEDDLVIEGPDFRTLSDEEVIKLIPKLKVIARCSPEDKLKLVKCLKSIGEVVAVTGDGTNDAPQLREADVGFAMGISGTEVAKDASDIILLDDNFTSIVKAVMWGRNVYDSIRKFVQFQLTVNVCAVCVAFVGSITHGTTPLKAVQLLWVNLIMDTFAALALATDYPTPELLKRPPHGRHSPLISRRMWNFIVGSAVFQLSILFFILYSGPIEWLGISSSSIDETRTTILFNTFVFLQLWNEINSRKLDDSNVFSGIFSNFIFLGIMVCTIFVQALLVQYGGSFSHTVPLNFNQWMFCAGVGSLSIPVAKLLRSIPTPPDVKSQPVQAPVVEPSVAAKFRFAQVGNKVLQRIKLRNAIARKPNIITLLRSSRPIHSVPIVEDMPTKV